MKLPFNYQITKALPLPQPRASYSVGGVGSAFSTNQSFEQLVKQGLYQNATVQGCLAAYTMTLNEPPIKVMLNTVEQPNHPLASLLRKPNQAMSCATFISFVSSYVGIGGNCYAVKVRNAVGQVVALYPYHDGQITPVPSQYEWIDHYAYKVDGQTIAIPREDVVHFRSHIIDPMNPHKGLSPILAAARGIDIYGEMESMIYSMLKNDAMPRGVLSYPVGTELNQQQRDSVQAQFGANYGGEQRGRTAVLGQGATYTRISFDLKELQADNVISKAEISICQAFRVHPLVAMTYAGLQNSTYSNMEEAFKQFTTLTRIPIWNQYEETIEAAFQNEYQGIQVEFDLSQVEALKPSPDVRNAAIVLQFEKGIITQDEAREALGYAVVGSAQYSYQLIKPAPAPLKHKSYDEAKADLEYSTKVQRMDTGANAIAESWSKVCAELESEVLANVKAAPFNYEKWLKKFLDGTHEARVRLAKEVIKASLEEVGATIADFGSDFDATLKASTLLSSEKITDSIGTIRDELRLKLAANSNLTSAEMKKLLLDTFATLKESRAALIGQTTATATSGATQTVTWRKMNDKITDPKKKIVRVWMVRNHNTRPTHFALDRVPESKDGTWNLGGYTVTYPADGNAPASEACNCHCTLTTMRAGEL